MLHLKSFDIDQLPTGKRILKNFFSLSIANLASRALSFVAVAYLARVLSAEGFGKINLVQAVMTYFGLLTHLGLMTLGIREIARDKSQIKRYTDNILTLKLVLTGVAFLLLVGFAWLVSKPADVKLLIILFGFTLFPAAFMLDWVFQGIERMEFIGVAQIVHSVTYVGLVLLLVRGPTDILRVPMFLFFSTAIAAGVLAMIFFSNYGWPMPCFDFAFWRKLIVQALPLGFSFIMIHIYYNINTIALGFMKGEEAVGWYNAAHKPILLAIEVAALFGGSLLPRLSQLASGSTAGTTEFLTLTSKTFIYVSLPAVVGGSLLGKKIILSVYGAEYNPSIIVFQLLIWQVFTVFTNVPFAYSLLAFGKQRFYLYSVTSGAVASAILTIILVPRYSLVGAAVSTLVAEVIVVSMFYIYARKVVRVSINRSLFKAAAGCGVIATLWYWLPTHWLINLSIGISLYVLILFLSQAFSPREVQLLWQSLT